MDRLFAQLNIFLKIIEVNNTLKDFRRFKDFYISDDIFTALNVRGF